MTPMVCIGAVLTLLLILFIFLVLKGTSIKLSGDHIAVGFSRYSIIDYMFIAKKIWIRPIKHSWRAQCVVQLAVFKDGLLVRMHSIKMRNEDAADILVSKIEKLQHVKAVRKDNTFNLW